MLQMQNVTMSPEQCPSNNGTMASQLRRFIILQCKLCWMRLVSTRIVLNFLCCCFGYADGTVLSLVRVFVLVRSAANVFLRSPGVAWRSEIKIFLADLRFSKRTGKLPDFLWHCNTMYKRNGFVATLAMTKVVFVFWVAKPNEICNNSHSQWRTVDDTCSEFKWYWKMEIRHNYRYVFALACMKQHCRKCGGAASSFYYLAMQTLLNAVG